MSAAKDQGWFCDGIAEEILNALAQLKGLKVAARASAFSFRGKDVDLATIGEKLNVATVLEGSVRRAGDGSASRCSSITSRMVSSCGRSATTARSKTSSMCRTRSRRRSPSGSESRWRRQRPAARAEGDRQRRMRISST
jgi:hypothetical protein